MTSHGWADLYAWQLDRASRTPLSRQIYMQVRSAVLSGALRAGTRVPSSRAMARQLGVARASVVSAYEQLLAEGYVESRHGSGTFISDDLTGLASRRRGAPRAIKARGGADIGADLSRLRAIGDAERRAPVQHRPHADRRAHRRDVAQPDPSRRAPARTRTTSATPIPPAWPSCARTSATIYGRRARCVASRIRSSSPRAPSRRSTSPSACCSRPATRSGSRIPAIP